MTNANHTVADDSQAHETGPQLPRLIILLLGGECVRTRQERPGDQRRLSNVCRHAGGWTHRREWRVLGVRMLRIRDKLAECCIAHRHWWVFGRLRPKLGLLAIQLYQLCRNQHIFPLYSSFYVHFSTALTLLNSLQLQQPLLVQIPQYRLDRLLHPLLPAPDHHLRILGLLIRRTHARELFNFSRSRLLI